MSVLDQVLNVWIMQASPSLRVWGMIANGTARPQGGHDE